MAPIVKVTLSRWDVLSLTIPSSLALGFLLGVYSEFGKPALLLALQDVGFGLFLAILWPISVFFVRRGFTGEGWNRLSPLDKKLWSAGLIVLMIAVVGQACERSPKTAVIRSLRSFP